MTDELENLTPQEMLERGRARIENRRQQQLRSREEFATRVGNMAYELHVAKRERDHYRRMFEQRHCWVLAEIKEVDSLTAKVKALQVIISEQARLLHHSEPRIGELVRQSEVPS